MLLSLLLKSRIWATYYLSFAMVIGYSRIYLLQHFLMDVAAGASVSVVVTYFCGAFLKSKELPPG